MVYATKASDGLIVDAVTRIAKNAGKGHLFVEAYLTNALYYTSG
jgi:hypothetical protein